jgi:hypothetical protein
MPMRVERHVYVHSEDLDGWLTPPNQPLQPVYAECFRRLEGLRLQVGDTLHELRILLNSGKPADYLESQSQAFGGRYVIGCSGAALREVGGETHWFTSPHADFVRLRRLLGASADGVGVVSIACGECSGEVAIEEGKRAPSGDVVLTLFCDPASVAHRWRFRGGADAGDMVALIRRLIEQHGLALSVLEPHADGALDVTPLIDGRPLAKWTLPNLAARAFPDAALHLTHGGDGVGDLPAMRAPRVLPLGAACCKATAFEAERRGVLTHRDPVHEAGVLDCYAQLADRGFYGPLSGAVSEIVCSYL